VQRCRLLGYKYKGDATLGRILSLRVAELYRPVTELKDAGFGWFIGRPTWSTAALPYNYADDFILKAPSARQ